MKKLSLIISVIFIAVFILPCFAGRRKKDDQKIRYIFPEQMSASVREAFTKECDKGQALYNLVCAKCHTTMEDGKQIVPDWKPTELVGYELRVLNPKHEEGIPEEQVSAEELGQIMTFLTYREKDAGK